MTKKRRVLRHLKKTTGDRANTTWCGRWWSEQPKTFDAICSRCQKAQVTAEKRRLKEEHERRLFLAKARCRIELHCEGKIIARGQGLSELMVDRMYHFAKYWSRSRKTTVQIHQVDLDAHFDETSPVEISTYSHGNLEEAFLC